MVGKIMYNASLEYSIAIKKTRSLLYKEMSNHQDTYGGGVQKSRSPVYKKQKEMCVSVGIYIKYLKDSRILVAFEERIWMVRQKWNEGETFHCIFLYLFNFGPCYYLFSE